MRWRSRFMRNRPAKEQEALSEKLIRIHVVANSDSTKTRR